MRLRASQRTLTFEVDLPGLEGNWREKSSTAETVGGKSLVEKRQQDQKRTRGDLPS